jgi:hypothetical protein
MTSIYSYGIDNANLRQLKWSRFETHGTRRTRQHKAKVYMHYMAKTIYHEVPVMAVFNVHQVREQRVPSQTLDEILLSFYKLSAKDFVVYLVQGLGALPKLFL